MAEPIEIINKKIFPLGGSNVITLPASWLKDWHLKAGDHVRLEVYEYILVIRTPETKRRKKINIFQLI